MLTRSKSRKSGQGKDGSTSQEALDTTPIPAKQGAILKKTKERYFIQITADSKRRRMTPIEIEMMNDSSQKNDNRIIMLPQSNPILEIASPSFPEDNKIEYGYQNCCIDSQPIGEQYYKNPFQVSQKSSEEEPYSGESQEDVLPEFGNLTLGESQQQHQSESQHIPEILKDQADAVEVMSFGRKPEEISMKVNLSGLRRLVKVLPKQKPYKYDYGDEIENATPIQSNRFGGIDIRQALQNKEDRGSLSDRFTKIDKQYLGDIYINRMCITKDDKYQILSSQAISLQASAFKYGYLNIPFSYSKKYQTVIRHNSHLVIMRPTRNQHKKIIKREWFDISAETNSSKIPDSLGLNHLCPCQICKEHTLTFTAFKEFFTQSKVLSEFCTFTYLSLYYFCKGDSVIHPSIIKECEGDEKKLQQYIASGKACNFQQTI